MKQQMNRMAMFSMRGAIIGAVVGPAIAVLLAFAGPGSTSLDGGLFGWGMGGLLMGVAEGGGFGAMAGFLAPGKRASKL